MKTLRRQEVFKRMPDSSKKDLIAIDTMVNMGWKYCPKKEYKAQFVREKVTVEVETEVKSKDKSKESVKGKAAKKK
jgi:hypothetical protein